MKIETYKLPSHWASSLINSDDSGLEQEDINAIDKFIKDNQEEGCYFMCVGCTEEAYFSHSNDAGTLACDVLEYTFDVSPFESDKELKSEEKVFLPSQSTMKEVEKLCRILIEKIYSPFFHDLGSYTHNLFVEALEEIASKAPDPEKSDSAGFQNYLETAVLTAFYKNAVDNNIVMNQIFCND